MSVGVIMGYLPFNSRRQGASAETAGPAFCRSASSKINGAFDLTNSVKKSRSSIENPSTLNQYNRRQEAFCMVKAKVNRTLDGYANGPVISCL